MYDGVAKATNFVPWNFWVFRRQGRSEFTYGLTDNHQLPMNRRLQNFVNFEMRTRLPLEEPIYSIRGINNVAQKLSISSHR